MKIDMKKLQDKGWQEKEIHKAQAILEKEEAHTQHFSKIVFWSALVVIVFANIIVSLVLIPFLIVLNSFVLYALVIVLAGTIGFLYNFLITDIGHLEKKNHILATIIIPILALANLITVVLVSNRFIADLDVTNIQHNPWVISIIFAVVFTLPYLIGKLRRK